MEAVLVDSLNSTALSRVAVAKSDIERDGFQRLSHSIPTACI
jgi:hypothetical protein